MQRALLRQCGLTLLPKEIFCPLAMLGTALVCATFLGGSMTCIHAHPAVKEFGTAHLR